MLLFCSSRKGCESTARHVAKFLKLPSVGSSDVSSEFSDAAAAVEALRRCPAGLDPILAETLPFGVAYHHAGLTVWKLSSIFIRCTKYQVINNNFFWYTLLNVIKRRHFHLTTTGQGC